METNTDNEAKENQEHLMRTQKLEAVAQLAGGIAHDFNNILTGILGYTLMMKREVDDKNTHYNGVVHIEELAKRAADLIRRLLAFSRQETMTPEVVDLNTFLTDVEKLTTEVIGASVEYKMTTQNCALPVLADVSHLKQVLLNLAT